MQMAMVLTAQKPTQRERIGELSEGLPGSTKSVACDERNAQELGRPESPCRGAGRQTETTSREAGYNRESDQPIVLRDGRAVHTGKGLTGIRSL
jgi:hypothetical protein